MKEFKTQKDFAEYLTSIKGEKPFNCDYLRVLPEKVNLQDDIIGGRDYYQGDLICLGITEKSRHSLTYHNCSLNGVVKSNSEGELEIGCNWHKHFKIEIKDQV